MFNTHSLPIVYIGLKIENINSSALFWKQFVEKLDHKYFELIFDEFILKLIRLYEMTYLLILRINSLTFKFISIRKGYLNNNKISKNNV